MKQSQVKPGVYAMLSLGGRRGAVAVTVRYLRNGFAMLSGKPTWVVVDSNGREHVVTPRQLQPMPAPYVATLSERQTIERHGGVDFVFTSMGAGQPGQTIDNGDTVITTTLHRLG